MTRFIKVTRLPGSYTTYIRAKEILHIAAPAQDQIGIGFGCVIDTERDRFNVSESVDDVYEQLSHTIQD